MTDRSIIRGDIVRTWYDTGAMGASMLFGRVIKAGPVTYTVRWESGLQNRVRQSDGGVWLVKPEHWYPDSLKQQEAGR